MRALGVGVLGLFCGLFAGFIVTEVIAGIALGSDGQLPDSMPLMLLLGYLTPAFAIAGIVVALLIDRRIRGRGRNELPVPVTVHLHGGKTPPERDGYPTDLIQPGNDSWEYVYPVDQPAATLWYHDHRMDFTGPQVYKGLAGFHLIRDEDEESLGLPDGDRDIPLMIADRAFAADGSMTYPSHDPSLTGKPGVTPDFMSGVLGDCLLVNGAPWPELEVDAARYRFRLLNASNARRYRLALDPPPRQRGGRGLEGHSGPRQRRTRRHPAPVRRVPRQVRLRAARLGAAR